MNEAPLEILFAALIGLLVLSAFFSSSETGMMSINRYRLKHLTKKGDHRAIRVTGLLKTPDKLIGLILIGNNLVNIFAASIATVIGVRLYGDAGIAAAGLILTFVMLVFAEVTPKTLAALYPERFAFFSSWFLKPLSVVLAPAVYLVNGISKSISRRGASQPRGVENRGR